jgi:hypothetical protein
MQRTKKYCVCGNKIRPLLHHAYCCPLFAVKNFVRNNAHEMLKSEMQRIFKDTFNDAFVQVRIERTEPKLEDFFTKKFENPDKKRGDILMIRADKNIIIDVSTTETTRNDDYIIGSAVESYEPIKMYQYIDWNLNDRGNELKLFLTETFCVIGKSTKNWIRSVIREISNNEKEYNYALNRFFCRLSIIMQKIRAKQFSNIFKNYSTEVCLRNPWRNPQRNL